MGAHENQRGRMEVQIVKDVHVKVPRKSLRMAASSPPSETRGANKIAIRLGQRTFVFLPLHRSQRRAEPCFLSGEAGDQLL